jgi:hypothetical protein
MDTLELLESYRKLVADGDAKGAQEFLTAHFKELPEELQGDLLIEMLKDAASENKLENIAAETSDLAMKMLDRVEEAEKELQEAMEKEDAAQA